MKKEETVRLLQWLQNIYPRRFSPNMLPQRKADLLDTFYTSFDGYTLEEVMSTCKEILKEQEDTPTISGILAICKSKRQSRLAEKQAKAGMDLSALPEDHPRRGCYYHKEALDAYIADKNAHKLNGRTFSDYCRAYPAVVWKDWADPALNADRFEKPDGAWSYMTEFKGWTTDSRGFCVPK